MRAYYNETDPHCAEWLRNLISAGHIAPGDVDERSIVDVSPEDLRGYDQCHFFAGIGGWSYALRLAGWPDDRPVWTGSCPCQPFSSAGAQRGSDDERHLWPAFFRIIRECRPRVVFGEQVAGAAGYAWWDHVAADLEGEAYSAAAADIGAHSIGAPHIRQRLYWVAYGDGIGPQISKRNSAEEKPAWQPPLRNDTHGRGEVCGMGDAKRERLERLGASSSEKGWNQSTGSTTQASVFDAWSDVEWIDCADGKARPIKPGLAPLADGISARVVRVRAYGNAIVPQVAAAFVMALRAP